MRRSVPGVIIGHEEKTNIGEMWSRNSGIEDAMHYCIFLDHSLFDLCDDVQEGACITSTYTYYYKNNLSFIKIFM